MLDEITEIQMYLLSKRVDSSGRKITSSKLFVWRFGSMAKIERIDTEGSFMTTLRLISDNGREATEINVPVWEVDAMETKIKNTTWVNIKALQAKKGTLTIKG